MSRTGYFLFAAMGRLPDDKFEFVVLLVSPLSLGFVVIVVGGDWIKTTEK